MNFFIFVFAPAAHHVEYRQPVPETQNMKTISMMAMVSAIAFSATAFSATPGAAKAGLIASAGRYCLSYDEGGMNCSFTSYAECEATASGINAECYGNGFRGHESFQGRPPGEYLGPMPIIVGIQ
jgi:hypothetical protein